MTTSAIGGRYPQAAARESTPVLACLRAAETFGPSYPKEQEAR